MSVHKDELLLLSQHDIRRAGTPYLSTICGPSNRLALWRASSVSRTANRISNFIFNRPKQEPPQLAASSCDSILHRLAPGPGARELPVAEGGALMFTSGPRQAIECQGISAKKGGKR